MRIFKVLCNKKTLLKSVYCPDFLSVLHVYSEGDHFLSSKENPIQVKVRATFFLRIKGVNSRSGFRFWISCKIGK